MAFCLPKFAAESLRQGLVSGRIKPEELSELSSQERREVFSSLVGEQNAKKVNASFEAKLLLKNQQQAMINWAKDMLGLKPEVRRDTIAKVEKMSEILQPDEINSFLEDLAEKKLGFHVTLEETGKLLDLARKAEALKPQAEAVVNRPGWDKKTETLAERTARMEYGISFVLFRDLVSALKPESKSVTVKEFLTEPKKYVERVGALTKSIVASIDNSLFGTQGIATLLNPKTTHIWVKRFLNSFSNIKKSLSGIDPLLPGKAEIFSRRYALDGTYTREQIALGLKREEAYPTSAPERIPVLGALFRASSDAYHLGSLQLRADLADLLTDAAKKNGSDITDKVTAESIGHLVNSTIGRGSLGVLEPAASKINVFMFSAKLLKGTFDTLTAHLLDPKVPFRADPAKPYRLSNVSFAQKQAAKNILSIVGTVHGVLLISEMLNPGSVEFDPRSTHWGQIKIGDTYINIVGPFRPLVRTIASAFPALHDGRLGFWRKESSGKWRDLSDGKFGQATVLDIIETFLEGKASPLLSVLMNHWRGKDFMGDKPTLWRDVQRLTTPISVQGYLQGKEDQEMETLIMTTFLNALGVNTYHQK